MDGSTAWINKLEKNGCRATGPRKTIIDLLANSNRALNPMEIFDHARKEYPKIGLVTVYRTLEKLEEFHLIQRVHQPGGCNSYLSHKEGHQHLIICERCGKADFFEGDDLDEFFEMVATKLGYSVNNHWLQLFGVCKNCSANR
jgi:Fur family transcriptional regulator, ferric uptake regulator